MKEETLFHFFSSGSLSLVPLPQYCVDRHSYRHYIPLAIRLTYIGNERWTNDGEDGAKHSNNNGAGVFNGFSYYLFDKMSSVQLLLPEKLCLKL